MQSCGVSTGGGGSLFAKGKKNLYQMQQKLVHRRDKSVEGKLPSPIILAIDKKPIKSSSQYIESVISFKVFFL